MPSATMTAPKKKPKAKPRRVQPPTEAQVWQMAETMPNRALRSFVLTAAYSGLRLSEVAGLEGRDVNVTGDSAILHVRHGKGGKPRHSVLLPQAVRELPLLEPRGYVFTNRYGTPYRTKTIGDHWRNAREKVGLPHLWFHDLRRFAATYMLDHGVSDLDVAVQLGHIDNLGRPNPDLVRRIYGFPSIDECLQRILAQATSMEGSK